MAQSQGPKGHGGMALNIRLRESSGASHDYQRRLATAGVPAHLIPVIQHLRSREREVLTWLAGDKDRAARFMLDPIATLRESKIAIGDGILDTLERHRRPTAAPNQDDARFAKVTVRAEAPKGEPQAPKGETQAPKGETQAPKGGSR